MRPYITNFYIALSLGILGCSSHSEKHPDTSCSLYSEMAAHYSGNQMKFKAAHYLIDGMKWHYTLDGELLDNYLNYLHMYSEQGNQALPIIDSLCHKDGYSISSLHPIADMNFVDSEYLITNIDRAFQMRDSMPWGSSVKWDDFIKYVIPYRIKDERLSSWRDSILYMYAPVIDSLRRVKCDSPLLVAKAILNKWNSQEFKWTSKLPNGPAIGLANVTDKAGTCLEFAHGVVYLMRAIGIPAGVDMVPARGENNSSHFWPFIKDSDGKTYVTCTENPTWVPSDIFDIQAPKIYRLEFSADSSFLKRIPHDVDYPIYLTPPCVSDVTAEYKPFDCHTIKISKRTHTRYPEYLAISSNDKWTPVDLSITDTLTLFKNVCGGVVACVGIWDGHSFLPSGSPFEIELNTGNIREISGSDIMQEVILYSKFPIDKRNGDLAYRVVGGRIEGSEFEDFRNATSILTITEIPKRRINTIYLSNPKHAFRYYRYIGPPDGYCNIAEVSLFSHPNDTLPMRGRVFGTPGSWDNDTSHTFEKVFDGNLDTSFDYMKATGGWSAIDLGYPVTIEKIIYVPRNRDNYIRKGDTYELFWFGNARWNSLGKQKAKSDSLIYITPAGALLYLRNHSRGKDERIFEYDTKKRKQRFW